ncbi:MAG TPA: FMN-binding negative transcriptional regulator [Salinimicrobium sp.]|nr:FMN-binding negative transcriptional regulator [Salinimicrobium sp.]
MYQPKKYKKENQEYIFEFIKNHPFATFVINGNRLLATHIPVLPKGISTDFILFGHISKHNEQFQYLKNGAEALLVFQGANAYVSSSWYNEKDISTWDYSAVHVNVKIKVQSEEELKDSLEKLVFHFEKNQEKPLYLKNIPKKIVDLNFPNIIGFWCEPFKIEAIAKLHQGFEREDVESVVAHLEADKNSVEISENIKKEHGL